jgi:iron(III) transport system substrate-binding protein
VPKADAPPKPAAPEAAKPAAPAEKAAPKAEGPAAAKTDPRLDELIKAANAEGKLSVTGPSTLGDQNFLRLVAAMNAKYGANIQGGWTSSGNFPATTAQLLTEYGTGGKPSWDAVLMNDTFLAQLSKGGYLEKRPYRPMFGLPERSTAYDESSVVFASQLVLPVYNTKLVPEADVPKTWEDLTDPKWKDKIGVHNAIHHFIRLQQIWGEDKTTEYVKKIAALNPKLGPINEVYQKMVLGETWMSFTQTNSQMNAGRRRGEPVAWVEVRPAIAPSYLCAGLKGGQSPSAAALFCGFMFDKAALDIWGEGVGAQSIFQPSTELGAIYAKNPNDVLILKDDFPQEELERLEKKYSPLLGFR